jgi:hypothetical protein
MTSERGTCLKSATKSPWKSLVFLGEISIFLWFSYGFPMKKYHMKSPWDRHRQGIAHLNSVANFRRKGRDDLGRGTHQFGDEKMFNNLHNIHNNIHNIHTIFTSYYNIIYIYPCMCIYTYASNHIYIHMYVFKSLRCICIDMFTYGKGLFFW